MTYIPNKLCMDAYKFFVSYAMMVLFPFVKTTFKFTDRSGENWLDPKYLDKEGDPLIIKYLDQAFTALQVLSGLPCGFIAWALKKIPFIPIWYWEWYNSFVFDRSMVVYWLDENGVLHIQTKKDNCYKTSLWEIMVLQIVAWVRTKLMGFNIDMDKIKEETLKKITYANEHNIPFAEFGTRRSISCRVLEEVIYLIKKFSKTCVGTSNVYYAYMFDMDPIGTFPHEWPMLHAAIYGFKNANKMALENWVKVFKGALNTALVDTYTTKSFLDDFTKEMAEIFNAREDSGIPVEQGEMIIAKYEELGIDPKTKTINFSDSITLPKAKELMDYFKGRIGVVFGMGGAWTNRFEFLETLGYTPANYVMKLWDIWCDNGHSHGLKISNVLGKRTEDCETEFEIAKQDLNL